MRSPEEFDAIRVVNRAALGLAGAPLGAVGLGNGILGAALGAAGPLRVSSAFPDVAVEWDPTAMNEPSQEGSGLGWWFTTRVARPEVTYAGMRFAPGDGHPDYSGVARALGWVATFLGVAATAWIGWRAFGPRRRANPRRARPLIARCGRSKYYVVARRAA